MECKLKLKSSETFFLINFLFFNLFLSTEGKHIAQTFRISYIEGYPDGVLAKYILGVNGQFPGPVLQATEGDTVEVTVINGIQDGQNVTLHWHGLHQRGFIFEDGVSMITQCPLAPGHSQVYRFNATQAGTYWYHSHFHSQYTEGLFGPLIIHAKNEAYQYYGDVTLMLSDWYHRPAMENERWYLTQAAFGEPPVIDSVLINGMGRYYCPSARLQNLTCRSRKQQRPVFKIQIGKIYRMRLINASARTTFNFSIAEHSIPVIEADGVDVTGPKDTEIVPIAAGQRYSVLIQCPSGAKNGTRYLIRADSNTLHMDRPGFININPAPDFLNPNASAILECTNLDLSSKPGRVETGTEHYSWVNTDPPPRPVISTEPEVTRVLYDMELFPVDKIPAPEPVHEEYTVHLTFKEHEETDVRHAGINYTSFTYPDDKPLLHKVLSGEPLDNQMMSIDIQFGNTVQLVINNQFIGPHPFHLHGHHFWLVGVGKDLEGNYIPGRHNLTRFGVKRDTLVVPDRSWAVIRFVADNPGIWLFHCHQEWHAVSGMAMVFMEGMEELMKKPGNGQNLPTHESLRVCNYFNQSYDPNGDGLEWWLWPIRKLNKMMLDAVSFNKFY